MLRVLVDATAVPPDRSGVGRYVDMLLPALGRAGLDVRVACRPGDAARYGAMGAGVQPAPAPGLTARAATRLAWEQIGLPRLAAALQPDVVHAPHYTHAVALRTPLVVTLHDATFFTDPGVHRSAKGPVFRAATRLALRRAACCVVPSHATASELVRVAGADPAKLVVAHHGVDTSTFSPPPPAAVDAARQALGLAPGERWVAFLGTLEPRKNLPALVRGWAQTCAGRPDPPALVLAGHNGWERELAAAAASLPPQLTLVQPGYLPLELLAGYLGGAEVVAYPSLGEGFGLPVLEAMACGAPVLTTRRLALPEVGGDAVAYTEPDAASIGADLGALLDDPGRRARLSEAGRCRAAGLTWDACAAVHLTAYERAVRQGPRR